MNISTLGWAALVTHFDMTPVITSSFPTTLIFVKIERSQNRNPEISQFSASLTNIQSCRSFSARGEKSKALRLAEEAGLPPSLTQRYA